MKEEYIEAFRQLGRLGGIGFSLAASIFIPTYIGFLIDRRWGTSPTWTVALLVVGVVGGFWSVYCLMWKELGKEDKRDKGSDRR
ncbi:MAG: AtpZ/AtpI family protein [bacterium]